jgi:hypothetical protein
VVYDSLFPPPRQDYFVAKYDSAGTPLWFKLAGKTSAGASKISTDASGHSFVIGFDGGSGFLAKYDPSGTETRLASIGGNGVGGFTDVSLASGNVLLSGYFASRWAIGTNILVTGGDIDGFIAKFDGVGNFLWVKQVGGTSEDYAQSVASDPDGNVYVSGFFQGTAGFGPITLISHGSADLFVAKFTSSGDVVWVQQAQGNFSFGYPYYNVVAVDARGYVSVGGSFSGTASFGSAVLMSSGATDIYAAGFDSAGRLLWLQQAGNGYATAIGVDASGTPYVAGDFGRTFGSITLTNGIGSWIFLAKLATNSPPPIPRLAITSLRGLAVLSWTTNSTGFALQTVADLSSNNAWIALTNVPVRLDGRNFVTNAISGTNRFYRLRKP